jgi:uncharacterized protein with PIN domain
MAEKDKPTFILDGMFGSLARWLRLLGYDTIFCNDWVDDDILAATEDRILLTRDKELITRAHARGLKAFNPGPRPIAKMLRRLQDHLGITFVINPSTSRCSTCNAHLVHALPEEVKAQVPPRSFHQHTLYWQCTNPDCRQVYWQGRHWKRIHDTLNKI